MKSLVLLWNTLARELAGRCCTSAHQDIQYVLGRSQHEGTSFLTISLPTFGKDFELCLDRGKVDDTVFPAFRKNGLLPRFLSGYARLVFDLRTGVLLDNPNLEAIYAVRQLTNVFSKILLDCEPRRVRDAHSEFFECEQEVKELHGTRSFKDFQRVSSLIFSSMFSVIDKQIYDGDIRPKHGPGSTADSLVGNQKYVQTTWPCRLEHYFPYLEMVLPNSSFYGELDKVDFLEPGAEIPVKVIDVPKTMKTPRIIAMEPTAMQYAQQGILRLIQDAIKGSYLNDFIGLDDQEPNQLMARQGSAVGDLATLDLSEASDRVSCESVSFLLRPHQHFHDAVLACRSRRARLLSGEVIPLAKFASMGSALCFPMEAMVFLVAIFLGIEKGLERPLTLKDVKSFKGRVRVYGDDIIVPVDYVRLVIQSLESFGLKVNDRKSFWNGKFRESCGREYYDGQDISIVRVRRPFPSSREDGQEIISTVSLRNQLFGAGFERPVDHLDSILRKVLSVYPVVGERSPVLGRLSFTNEQQFVVTNNSIPKVKGWIVRPSIPVNEIDGWPALRKCLSSMEDRNATGSTSLGNTKWSAWRMPETLAKSTDHLRRSGRPRVVDIKLGVGSSDI
ncbi:TPA_asm: RNA-directed RNA polymerase [ssRNA phage Gerhypos.1_14]|uniref:RNA-directed RNA polymerase n=2 Tax=Leviviricetes TaxID=2842243 RepID=A0A8S5L129_9VIRU|nr:RNA-directed RNA polymerase [ssRNA phage Gerhypos.1_14]QDH90461.1 MAG: RNA-dependent RNA polymerase [Leviviridae sp.]DAD51606.1 TPA_asm: RNA-directed RNA polymerase [ssRNA phage Gerhypos.1_14]